MSLFWDVVLAGLANGLAKALTAGSFLGAWIGAWVGACCCEPPQVFVASIADRLETMADLDARVAEVNRFWAYRARCGRRRCTSPPGPLTSGQVALYMPVGRQPRIRVM